MVDYVQGKSACALLVVLTVVSSLTHACALYHHLPYTGRSGVSGLPIRDWHRSIQANIAQWMDSMASYITDVGRSLLEGSTTLPQDGTDDGRTDDDEHHSVPGVYALTYSTGITFSVYIGKSFDPLERWQQHGIEVLRTRLGLAAPTLHYATAAKAASHKPLLVMAVPSSLSEDDQALMMALGEQTFCWALGTHDSEALRSLRRKHDLETSLTGLNSTLCTDGPDRRRPAKSPQQASAYMLRLALSQAILALADPEATSSIQEIEEAVASIVQELDVLRRQRLLQGTYELELRAMFNGIHVNVKQFGLDEQQPSRLRLLYDAQESTLVSGSPAQRQT